MRKLCCKKEGRTNKGVWSKEEDEKLIQYIKIHGEGCWHSLPKAAGLDRCGKSCRLRWINYLRPDIKRGNFAQDEEDLIIKLHALLGNRWALIAGRLPGRTDNEVKNYWNSHIRKKLISMGIDPNNHKLHHNLRRQQTQYPRHSASAFSVGNSAESRRKDANNCPRQLKCCGNYKNAYDHGLANNAISCNEEETSPTLNLNLDLNIATS